jgi:type II secretory pathway component PulF
MSFVGVFVTGTAMSMMLPQCMFSTSKVVNENTSALATSLTSCIAPGFGGFFSAIVFTNITQALYGDSTVLRYRFAAIVALVFAAGLFVLVTYRAKRSKKAAV